MYDISAGVPRLGQFQTINIDGLPTGQSIHEIPGLAINMTAVDSVNGLSGVTYPVPASVGWRVATLLQAYSIDGHHDVCIGFSDGTKFSTMALRDETNNNALYLYTWDSFSTINSPGGGFGQASFAPKDVWLGVSIRLSGGDYFAFYEVSADGVFWSPIVSEQLTMTGTPQGSNAAGPWLANYESIFIGHVYNGGVGACSLTMRCYNPHGIGTQFPSANPPNPPEV